MREKVLTIQGTEIEIDWRQLTRHEIESIGWNPLYEQAEPCSDPGIELPGEGKPYPNEHACRVEDPGKFQKGSFRRMKRKAGTRTLWLIIGRLRDSTKATLQAFRYPKDEWPAAAAKAHCKRHEGQSFEPASGKSALADDTAHFFSIESPDREEIFAESRREWGNLALSEPLPDLENDFERLEKVMEPEEYLREVSERMYERGEFEFHAEIKGIDDLKRIIEGYANTRNIDRYEDIILPPVFRGSLKYYVNHGKIFIDHDYKNPIGRPQKAYIDKEGLWVRGSIYGGVQFIDEAWALIEMRLKDAYSVGFKILETEWKKVEGFKDKIRHITKLELYEVSVVALPANRQSVFDVVKGMVNGTDLYDPVTRRCIEVGEPRYKIPVVSRDPMDEDYASTIDFLRRMNERIENDSHVTATLSRLRALNEKLKAKEE